MIHTAGEIKDGDNITVSSPIFSSIDFKSGSVQMTSTFDVPFRKKHREDQIVSDGILKATLVCDDNNVFGMYVTA